MDAGSSSRRSQPPPELISCAPCHLMGRICDKATPSCSQCLLVGLECYSIDSQRDATSPSATFHSSHFHEKKRGVFAQPRGRGATGCLNERAPDKRELDSILESLIPMLDPIQQENADEMLFSLDWLPNATTHTSDMEERKQPISHENNVSDTFTSLLMSSDFYYSPQGQGTSPSPQTAQPINTRTNDPSLSSTNHQVVGPNLNPTQLLTVNRYFWSQPPPATPMTTALFSEQVFLQAYLESGVSCWPQVPRNLLLSVTRTHGLLKYAICAYAAGISTSIECPVDRLGIAKSFFEKAKQVLEVHAPDMYTPQALALLFFHCIELDDTAGGWKYLSSAIQICYDLQLNKWNASEDDKFGDEFEGLSESITKQDLRRLVRSAIYWTCYIADKQCSALFGYPSLCKDSLSQQPVSYLVRPISPSSQTPISSELRPDLLQQVGIMSSTEWYVPPIPDLGIREALITLTKLFGRVMDFSQQSMSNEESSLEYPYASISSSLRHWQSSLSSVITRAELKEGSEGVTQWMILYLKLYYYTCVCMLNHSRLLLYIKTHKKQYEQSFTISKQAADEATPVVESFLEKNRQFEHVPRFIIHCVSTTGLFHALIANFLQRQSLARQETIAKLHWHVEALSELSNVCVLARAPLVSLKKEYDQVRSEL